MNETIRELRDEIKKLEEKIKEKQSSCKHKWEVAGTWDEDDGWSFCQFSYGVYVECSECGARDNVTEGKRWCNR